MTKTCSTCTLYNPIVDDEDYDDAGECYRYPPIPLPVMALDGAIEVNQYARPIIQSSTRACGEHAVNEEDIPAGPSAMRLSAIENIHGRMLFDAWIVRHSGDWSAKYVGENLVVTHPDQNEIIFTPGDMVIIASDGVRIG